MKRRGFVLIELPLVLGLLATIGLGIVLVIRFFADNVPWYAWPLGGAAPPCLLIVAAVAYSWRESRDEKANSAAQKISELD